MAIVTITRANKYVATDVYQWDKNRTLEIYGLTYSTLPEIHFTKSGMSHALVKQVTGDADGVIKVQIPNSLLEDAKPLTVYICFYNGVEFYSKYSVTINVRPRLKPADYIAEDDEKIYSYNALENLVNETVINLERDQASFREEMLVEFEKLSALAKNADTVDGYHADDFEYWSKPGKTVFNSDGSITTVYDDGSTETSVFNTDGSITTTRNTPGLGVKTENVKFNADGSITVTVA